MSTLISYHGDAAVKVAAIDTIRAHARADSLIQGYGYWKDGKGCAVGCQIQSGDHMEYETRFGIPVALAMLEDAIFEGLPVETARKWPERFMGAIEPNRDLSRVQWNLLHWILTDKSVNPGIANPLVKEAVKQCADLIAALKDGGTVEASAAWSAVNAAKSAEESAAKSAAKSAASAAWSAVNAVKSAEESAASAAWSAVNAAKSAAWSAAESAAESAAWEKIADKLVELIGATPVAEIAT